MAANRQDAWTADEDLLLAEVTLRQIREGGTQLAAFAEVAERLGRTAAACGFRWNSTIRKKYEEAISIAKGMRKKNGKRRKGGAETSAPEEARHFSHHPLSATDGSGSHPPFDARQESITFDEVVRYLKRIHESLMRSLEEFSQLKKRMEDLEQENGQLKGERMKLLDENHRLLEENFRLQERNGQLLAEIGELQRELERVLSLEENYKLLQEMMERIKEKPLNRKKREAIE